MAGGKYAARNNRKAKTEGRKQVDQALDALNDDGVRSAYVRPSRQDCETDVPIVWTPSETTCLFVQVWTQGTRVADFVMMHFVQLGDSEDGWYELARIDCAHGTVHIHEDEASKTKKGPRTLFDLHTPSDVADGYDVAYDELDLRWKAREGEMHNDRQRSPQHKSRPTGALPQVAAYEDCEG